MKTPCRVLLGFLAAASLLLGAVADAARPLIEIDGAAFRPYPVAVADFKAKGEVEPVWTVEMTKVLRDDLNLSGLFQVLDPRSFIASPEHEGVTVGTIAFSSWTNVGADGLVKALVSRSGDDVSVEVHAFDVVRARETFKQVYTARQIQPRRLAHRIADALITHYTGERGLFQSRIAFALKRGRAKDVCIMDVDGHNVECPVKNGFLNLLPSWDGTDALLFTSYLRGNTDLYRARLSGGAPAQISSRPGLNSGARVSPDGKKIALTLTQDGNSEIYLLSRSGGEPQRLTKEPWAIDSSPSWSPDGKRIAFVSDRAGSPQIYVMGADGKSPRRLTFQGNYNQTPAWSPRGDRIAFTARDERNCFDVFTVEVESGTIHRVTQDQGNNEEPTWAPNGRLLAFISDRNGRKALFISDMDGRKQVQVSTTPAAIFTPAWSGLNR